MDSEENQHKQEGFKEGASESNKQEHEKQLYHAHARPKHVVHATSSIVYTYTDIVSCTHYGIVYSIQV